MRSIKYSILLLCVGIFSCTKKSTPEETLKGFVNYRFSADQEISTLIEMTTSPLKERIEALNGEGKEEDLKKFLDSTKVNKKKLKVLLKNCEPEKCFITYVVSYAQGSENPRPFAVDVKKIAQIVKVGESWKVSDVNNVKTYIEDKKGLEVSAKGPTEAPESN